MTGHGGARPRPAGKFCQCFPLTFPRQFGWTETEVAGSVESGEMKWVGRTDTLHWQDGHGGAASPLLPPSVPLPLSLKMSTLRNTVGVNTRQLDRHPETQNTTELSAAGRGGGGWQRQRRNGGGAGGREHERAAAEKKTAILLLLLNLQSFTSGFGFMAWGSGRSFLLFSPPKNRIQYNPTYPP